MTRWGLIRFFEEPVTRMVWSIRLALRKAEEPMSAEMIMASESASAARNCPFIDCSLLERVSPLYQPALVRATESVFWPLFFAACTLSSLISEHGRKLLKLVLWALFLGAVLLSPPPPDITNP